MSFRITQVTVTVSEKSSDFVLVHTNLPNPLPNDRRDYLALQFQAASGTGGRYIRQYFGIEPTVNLC
jgi:hypothetical protein